MSVLSVVVNDAEAVFRYQPINCLFISIALFYVLYTRSPAFRLIVSIFLP